MGNQLNDARPADRIRILLSEGSSNSARQTLYALGRRYQIDIVDPSPWCQCRFSCLVRRWHRCPPLAKDPIGYLKTVADLLRSRQYDVLLPTHEQVFLISKYREVLQRYVGLAVPAYDAIRRVQGKADFARSFRAMELPTPETCVATNEQELLAQARFPCYLKLNYSTASHGVRLINDRQSLLASLYEFERAGAWSAGEEILTQQPAQGIPSTATAVFEQGRLIAAHCMEILATGIGGGPSLRVSVHHPVVVEHFRQLGEQLDWHGALLVDYFYDRATAQPLYLEVNPRIGETVNACLCGLNLCELIVQISLGRHLDSVALGQCGVKSHAGFILLLADAFNGASRKELLRRLGRSWMRQNEYACENEMTRPKEDWASPIASIATSLRLLALPRSAVRLSRNTVANYSLNPTAVQVIEQYPTTALASYMARGA